MDLFDFHLTGIWGVSGIWCALTDTWYIQTRLVTNVSSDSEPRSTCVCTAVAVSE